MVLHCAIAHAGRICANTDNKSKANFELRYLIQRVLEEEARTALVW